MAKRKFLVVGDFGKDLDDEDTLVLQNGLRRQGISAFISTHGSRHQELGEFLAVIGNLAPAVKRARLAKGTLKELGQQKVPVGIGTDCGASTEGHDHEFENIPYMASADELEDGYELLVRSLEGSEDQSIVLVLISGLTDAANLIRNHPGLVRAKVAQVAIMGGVEVKKEANLWTKYRQSLISACASAVLLAMAFAFTALSGLFVLVAAAGAGLAVLARKLKAANLVARDEDGYMVPDTAANNMFDFESAKFVHRRLQELRIPMTILTREAAYACKVPRSIYDRMAATGHPVGIKLKNSQQRSIEDLWRRANLPAGNDGRAKLPDRCDKAWFLTTFCAGKGQDRTGADSIWDLIESFNLYDPMTLVAAVEELRDEFYMPAMITVNGMVHRVIGVTRECHGVKRAHALADFMQQGLLAGCSRNAGR